MRKVDYQGNLMNLGFQHRNILMDKWTMLVTIATEKEMVANRYFTHYQFGSILHLHCTRTYSILLALTSMFNESLK